jgi:nucleotide-binding universal stress UspA family protein
MTGELVVGYDGSEGSKVALRAAAGLAQELDAGLVVAFGYHVDPAGGEVADLAAALRERGERLVAEALQIAGESGVEAQPAVINARPAEGLANLAAERGARMIVVGTRGEHPLAGALLGAVPHRLLHLSTVPVVVVPV